MCCSEVLSKRPFIMWNLEWVFFFSIFLVGFGSVVNAQSTECPDLQKYLQIAAELRGIAPPINPRCRALSDGEFEKRVYALAHHRINPDDIKAEEFVAKAFSLVPEDFPFQRCIYQMADTSIVALYDHINKEIILRSNNKAPQSVMVHEAVHLLQDLRYDLSEIYRKFSDTTDSKMAIGAIIEGDAIRIQQKVEKEEPSEIQYDSAIDQDECALTSQISDILYFPYDFGRLYFNRSDIQGPKDLFREPPLNTAQVLNPAFVTKPNLIGDREPALCSVAFGRCYDVIARDSLGQYYLQKVLSAFLTDRASLSAAVGWQNDRILVAMNPSRSEGIARWVIESIGDKDSDELWGAFVKWIEAKTHVSIKGQTGGVYIENDPSFAIEALRKDKVITLTVNYRPSTT